MGPGVGCTSIFRHDLLFRNNSVTCSSGHRYGARCLRYHHPAVICTCQHLSGNVCECFVLGAFWRRLTECFRTADTPSLAKVVIGTKGAQIKAIMEKSGTGLSWKRGQLGWRQNRARSCMIAFHCFSVWSLFGIWRCRNQCWPGGRKQVQSRRKIVTLVTYATCATTNRGDGQDVDTW